MAPVLGLGAVLGIGLFARKASAKTPASPADPQQSDPQPSDPSSDQQQTPKTTPKPKPTPQPQPPTPDVRFPVYEGKDGAFMLQELLKTAGVDQNWQRFFLSIASGESGFTSNMVLGDPKLYPTRGKPSKQTATLGPAEAAGARKAYDRAEENRRLDGCPWPADAYSWGSGGWLAMLPANAWYAYMGTSLRCRHPWYLLHPADHVVVGIDFARRLMDWKAFVAEPTWLTLRVGWGNPSAMDEPDARERIAKKFSGQLQTLGVAPAWMYQEVTPLPKRDIEGTWETLMKTFGFVQGKRGA